MTVGHIVAGDNMKNQRLINLRENAGLTQEQLADMAEVSQSMIARIESGKRDPRKLIKVKLASIFKVKVDWLFYEQVDDQQSYNSLSTGTEGS
jgi:DNA-binding XRE family transcriptional regulator